MPTLAVIVPARNEAATIGRCLNALSGQTYPADRMSLTVVDDSSTDGTAKEVRERAPTVGLIDAGLLPDGWFGKPHACWRGAELAETDWLCFIDADVCAGPDLTVSAVAAAEAGNLDMLSVQPFQELDSFWERLIIPSGMLMIACAKRPVSLGMQSGGSAAVNGQILLVRRSAYQRIGGHAAVHAEVCEDTGLAQRMLSAGFRVKVVAGEEFARVRMYHGFSSLWEGFSKNAVDIMGGCRATVRTAVLSVFVAWAVPLIPLGLRLTISRKADPAAAAGLALASFASCVALGVQGGALRHFRASLLLLPLLPVGVTAAAALAIGSARLRRTGNIRWKGRSYPRQDHVGQ